jgi:hypothetical protein
MIALSQKLHAGPEDPLWLSALLAGLGSDAAAAAAELKLRSAAGHQRMCIDGGANALIAVGAPGGRRWEAHILSATDPIDGRQDWQGVRISGTDSQILTRSMFRGRSGTAAQVAHAAAIRAGQAAVSRFERWHGLIGPQGRIYSVGNEPDDRGGARVAWQLDRHAPVLRIIADLAGEAGRDVAVTSLSAVHGFDLSATSGPWSVALSVAAPECGARIGSTRWAWAVEDAGKRDRLARWIHAHGGDAGYAAALHDLIAGIAPSGQTRTIGRAVEIDIVDGRVTGAIAYLGTACPPPAIAQAEAGLLGRSVIWPG